MFSILFVLSIFASCIPKLCYWGIYINDCYVLLMKWLSHDYGMSLCASGNTPCFEVYFGINTVTPAFLFFTFAWHNFSIFFEPSCIRFSYTCGGWGNYHCVVHRPTESWPWTRTPLIKLPHMFSFQEGPWWSFLSVLILPCPFPKEPTDIAKVSMQQEREIPAHLKQC